MPKVQHVKARKDYPAHGVKKGDMCYVWSLKTGPTSSRDYRQLTPPKRAQLTTSDYLGQLYSLFDDSAPTSPDDIRQLAESLRELGQEQQGKFDNMPEGLQQGDTGQMIEERANNCESSADELDSLADEWETAVSEYDDAHDEYMGEYKDYEEAVAAYETEHAAWSEDPSAYKTAGRGNNGEEPEEPDEPEEPEEVDEDSFTSRVSEHEPE